MVAMASWITVAGSVIKTLLTIEVATFSVLRTCW